MGKKLQSIVNAPHKKLNEWSKKISETNPDKNIGKVMKFTGIGLTQISRFLALATKYALLDNHLIRALEKDFESIKNIKDKEGKEVVIKKILKKHPTVMALLLNWLVLGGIVVGGGKTIVKDKDKEPVEQSSQQKQPVYVINDEIEKLYPSLYIGLAELETYRLQPKLHKKEKRYTYYLGLTWVYERDAKGKIVQHDCVGKYKQMAEQFTEQENQEQLKCHIEYETLVRLKSALQKYNYKPNEKTKIALLWVGYQRSADLDEIVKRLSSAKTKQQKADAFTYYPGRSEWKNGTLKRRWVCAAYAIGLINDNDLLNMYRDAFTGSDINTYCRFNKDETVHFKLDEETVTKIVNMQNQNDLVKDFIAERFDSKSVKRTVDFETAQANQKHEKMDSLTAEDMTTSKSMAEVNAGDELYKQKKYSEAVKAYKSAIEIDPDNMEAYSSLSLAYIKLGDKNESIENYENACESVKKANARMNANKNLLFDADIKAASYFNAGYAREKIGDVYSAQGQLEQALIQYIKAIKNYENAYANNDKGTQKTQRANFYKKSINNVTKSKAKIEAKLKSKKQKISFNNAKNKLDMNGKNMLYKMVQQKKEMA